MRHPLGKIPIQSQQQSHYNKVHRHCSKIFIVDFEQAFFHRATTLILHHTDTVLNKYLLL